MGTSFSVARHKGLAVWLPKLGDHAVVWGLWGVTPSIPKDALVLWVLCTPEKWHSMVKEWEHS